MGLSVKDFSKCCRCCLVMVADMKPLFGACLNVMLMKLMNMEVTPTDGLPQQMCLRCVLKLSSAYTFYITVLKNQKTLEEILKQALKSGDLPEIASNDEKKEFNTSDKEVNTLKEESSVCIQPFNAPKESTIPHPIRTPKSNMPRRVNYGQAKCDSEESTDNEESYQCSQCNQNSKDEEDLKTHLQTHLGAKRECKDEAVIHEQLCNICGARFRLRTSLHKHLRQHRARHPCGHCSKTFAELSTLRVHLVSHSLDQKPYRCGECGRSFGQRVARDKHARRHRDARLLPCDMCDKTFQYKYSLQRHRTSAHSIHECAVCNKLFNGNKLLDMHMRYHKKGRMGCSETECLDKNSIVAEAIDIQTVTVEFLCLMCTTKFQTRESLEFPKLCYDWLRFEGGNSLDLIPIDIILNIAATTGIVSAGIGYPQHLWKQQQKEKKKLQSQRVPACSMEWWHIGPLLLAVIVFLLAGTVIERQVEAAVFRMINRQPPASQETVGVETSAHRQQEPQQQTQQLQQKRSQQQNQQRLQGKQSQQRLLQTQQSQQNNLQEQEKQSETQMEQQQEKLSQHNLQIPSAQQQLAQKQPQHELQEKKSQEQLQQEQSQQEYHKQQLQQHTLLQKPQHLQNHPLDDTLPLLPVVSGKSLHPTSKTTIISKVDLFADPQTQ